MKDRSEYLNFIYKIYSPTTKDFYDYLRILTLLLQEEADKGRWDGITVENFTVYDSCSFHNTDMGSKIEYCYNNFKYEAGCRFTITDSKGDFYLFFVLYPLWEKAAKCIVPKGIVELESDTYYDCGICKERIICSSIYQVTQRIITDIEDKYPNCIRIYDEMEEEPIGVEIKLVGDSKDIFIQTCKYLDFLIPVLTEERPTEAIKRIKTISPATSTELSDAFLPPSSILPPCFKIFERDSESIEKIYNNPHGLESEYHEEEPPF